MFQNTKTDSLALSQDPSAPLGPNQIRKVSKLWSRALSMLTEYDQPRAGGAHGDPCPPDQRWRVSMPFGGGPTDSPEHVAIREALEQLRDDAGPLSCATFAATYRALESRVKEIAAMPRPFMDDRPTAEEVEKRRALAAASRAKTEAREAEARKAANALAAHRDAHGIPHDAQPIALCLYKNESDSMSDYFHASEVGSIIIGWTRTSRADFAAWLTMAERAANAGDLPSGAVDAVQAMLLKGREAIHRDNHSGGAGNWIGAADSQYSSGWRIRHGYTGGGSRYEIAPSARLGTGAAPAKAPTMSEDEAAEKVLTWCRANDCAMRPVPDTERPRVVRQSIVALGETVAEAETWAEVLALLPSPESSEPSESGAYRLEDATNKRGAFFLAVPAERLERATFDAERQRAKACGGWYSRAWKGQPGGFGFSTEAERAVFTAGEGS